MRIDTALTAGYTMPAMYDSLAAKVMTLGKDRGEAIAKMRGVLSEMVIDGIETNRQFQLELLSEADFVAGEIDTGFVEEFLKRRMEQEEETDGQEV